MNYEVTLHKIMSSHSNERTDIAEGTAFDLPTVGKPFTMYGKGLEFGTRVIQTTEIIELNSMIHPFNSVYIFKTLNSVYCVLAKAMPYEQERSVG